MTRVAVIRGIGAWLPPTVVTNDMLAASLDTSDEWIRSRTGIGQRHVVDPGMATGDLAVEAGRRALDSAGVDSVDMVVLATTTPDRPCPATAPDVAHRLGLTGVPAFDVSAVCSGFLYALSTAAAMIGAGRADHVLVIAAEAFTTLLDPQDRSTVAIFGDGAGAMVLGAGREGDPGAVLGIDLGSDGALADLITVRAGGSRQPLAADPTADVTADPADAWFTMQGREVFRNAVVRMDASARTVLGEVGWSADDVDLFVGHQANARILKALGDRLGVPGDKVFSHIEHVGNTAGASIPVALADAAASGRLRGGDKVLLSAFGGGATWGSAALNWPDIVAG
ncbi:beta-ketoacyl-ACP synthase III [Streptomyces sp. NPDC057705]|uniref:beta-ketoacyl-ACP synthase III n=1 Tax=Streptomyces sp. NPDC057705 TaxID=3346222 RepID=UPI0036ACABBA